MANNMEVTIYKLGNILYKYAFPIYKPLYFQYKQKSDKKKIKHLREIIKADMTILDIGANIGFYTSLFSELVGANGKVYAFEPEDINFKHLKSITSKYNNITLEKSAVGNISGKIKLYHSKNLNVDHQTYDTGENRKYSEIQSIALDDYFIKNEKIDFIKIDIQGYDFFAISGLKETIKRSDNLMIFGEFWPYGLKKAGVDYRDYIKLLEDLGIKMKFFCSEEDVKNFNNKINDWNFSTDFLGSKH